MLNAVRSAIPVAMRNSLSPCTAVPIHAQAIDCGRNPIALPTRKAPKESGLTLRMRLSEKQCPTGTSRRKAQALTPCVFTNRKSASSRRNRERTRLSTNPRPSWRPNKNVAADPRSELSTLSALPPQKPKSAPPTQHGTVRGTPTATAKAPTPVNTMGAAAPCDRISSTSSCACDRLKRSPSGVKEKSATQPSAKSASAIGRHKARRSCGFEASEPSGRSVRSRSASRIASELRELSAAKGPPRDDGAPPPPAHRNAVGDAAKHAIANAIFRNARGSRSMPDVDLDDAESLISKKRRKKPVQTVENRELGQRVAPNRSKGAARIGHVVPCDPVSETIPNFRRQLSDKAVMPRPANTTNSVDSRSHRIQEFRNVLRRVLPISVEGDNDLTESGAKSGCLGGALAAANRVTEDARLRRRARHAPHRVEGSVGARVVDQQKLEGLPRRPHGVDHFARHRLDALLLVETREHNAHARARLARGRATARCRGRRFEGRGVGHTLCGRLPGNGLRECTPCENSRLPARGGASMFEPPPWNPRPNRRNRLPRAPS